MDGLRNEDNLGSQGFLDRPSARVEAVLTPRSRNLKRREGRGWRCDSGLDMIRSQHEIFSVSGQIFDCRGSSLKRDKIFGADFFPVALTNFLDLVLFEIKFCHLA